LICDSDFCIMKKQLEEIKKQVTERIHKAFMDKYDGNKSKLAKAAGCDEKTLRLLFDGGSGMTLNLLFKLAYALDIEPSELLRDLSLQSKSK